MTNSKRKHALALFLAIAFMVFTVAPASQAYWHRRHHHSKARGALVGGVGGALVGGVVGGKTGALVGAGAGAGTGYLVQRARNRHHRHHYYSHYRR